jgi:hypothetical protein
MGAVVLGVLGAIGSVIGIVAYFDARANKRVKRLVWEKTTSSPLAAASKAAGDYKLSILYEQPDMAAQVIDSADVSYVRFANLGKEPIRRDDIAAANVLRLIVAEKEDGLGRPLDVAIAAASRDVIRVGLGVRALDSPVTSVCVDFDFLDFEDGAVIRILTNGLPADIRMEGDIVGMPQGLHEWEGSQGSETEIRGWAVFAWAAAEVLAFSGLGVLFRTLTGGWTGVWVLLLAPLVFVVVLLLFMLATEGPSAYKRRRLRFPRSLAIPHRFAFDALFGADGPYVLRPVPRPPKPREGELRKE